MYTVYMFYTKRDKKSHRNELCDRRDRHYTRHKHNTLRIIGCKVSLSVIQSLAMGFGISGFYAVGHNLSLTLSLLTWYRLSWNLAYSAFLAFPPPCVE